ncbi:MAG: VWA domain-containing protein [Roseobacter sp.]
MSKVTRFTAADPGPAARVTGFIAHLRAHGFRLGVAETQIALQALGCVNAISPTDVRRALKSVCSGCREDNIRFEALFDAFWMAEGRVRHKIMPSQNAAAPKHTRSSRTDETLETSGTGSIHAPEDEIGAGTSYAEGTGKLMASKAQNLMKKDLRELVSTEDIRAAEQIAVRLGKALRDRRSRRRRAGRRGTQVDLRRSMRASLSTGGEPLHLAWRKRPDRPVKIVALCDVSGSMMHYARPFLAFLAGMMRAGDSNDAYLFHTRLVRITEALRDDDPLRALNRITLLADGFGGGSEIAANLDRFGKGYARRFVDGRSVVLILSDGYDSAGSEVMGPAMQRLKRRGCKIVWLNPLKGWKDYAPVAKGMAAALPHLDDFVAAASLNDLAALEYRLARL